MSLSNKKIKEYDIFQYALFGISPILSLPISLYGISKKSNTSIILFICFMCFLSYMYIPNIEDDRCRHIEFFIFAKENSWNHIFSRLVLRPDFIFHLLLASFAKLGLNFQMVAAILAFISLYIPLNIIIKTLKEKNTCFFSSFLLFLFSINLLALFSGMRFYLASSVLLWSYYQSFYLNHKQKGFFILLVAGFIHFSIFLFLIPLLLFTLFKNKSTLSKVIFVLSFFFLFIPKDALFSLFFGLDFLGTGIETKINLYLMENDFIESGIANSTGNADIIYWGGILWLYVAYIYLLLTLKRTSFLRTLFFFNASVINLFYSAPTVFERYSIVLQFLFILIIIDEAITFKKNKMLYVFIFLFSIRFIFQLIIMRNNITASYLNTDVLLLITGLFRTIPLCIF